VANKPIPQREWCSSCSTSKSPARTGGAESFSRNLEEIWASGAVVQTDKPIAPSTRLRFVRGGYQFYGQVVARRFFVSNRLHDRDPL